MKHNKKKLQGAALLLAGALSLPCAADWRPDAVALEVGASPARARSGTVGLVWDLPWRSSAWGMEASAQAEAFFSGWRAPDFGGGHQHFYQVGVVPVLRLVPREGSSRWYFEAGIGVSTTDRLYRSPGKEFSTRFNFYDLLGVGYRFDGGRQEFGVRVLHISNADIRKPNPGEEFLLLRYLRRF